MLNGTMGRYILKIGDGTIASLRWDDPLAEEMGRWDDPLGEGMGQIADFFLVCFSCDVENLAQKESIFRKWTKWRQREMGRSLSEKFTG